MGCRRIIITIFLILFGLAVIEILIARSDPNFENRPTGAEQVKAWWHNVTGTRPCPENGVGWKDTTSSPQKWCTNDGATVNNVAQWPGNIGKWKIFSSYDGQRWSPPWW